jgi:hypothetical protein
MESTITKKRRVKQAIPSMMPVKQWLTTKEACSYLDMSINKFNDFVVEKGITVSCPGHVNYYRVSELNKVIEDSIIIKKTA